MKRLAKKTIQTEGASEQAQPPPLDRLPWHIDSVPLDDSFPAYCSGIFHHSDRPITFLQRHRVIEIGYCHSGKGIFIVGKNIIRFHAGDVILIPSEEIHIAQSDDDTESIWHFLHCDPAALVKPLLDDFALTDFSIDTWKWSDCRFSSKEYPQIHFLVKTLADEFDKKNKHWKNAVRSLFYMLFVVLHRYRISAGHDDAGIAAESSHTALMPRIKSALEYMLAHLGDEISIETLAKTCCMSTSNFRRIFFLATGKSPHEYLAGLRISTAAMELRSTHRSVSDIASFCGYQTLSAFNKAFREQMKMPPRTWRR